MVRTTKRLTKSMHTERITEYKLVKLAGIFLLAVVQFGMMSELYASERMYRYIDENGKTVVSSTLPPKYSQKGYEILNMNNIVIKVVSPRKTPEQLEAEKREAERLEKERQLRLEQERLDTILINSYTDISDIERARDNELESKERNIMLLQNNIRRYTKLLEDAQTRAARDERLGKDISKTLTKEIEQFKRRIASEEREVEDSKENQEIISDRYNTSINRFSELKAAERLKQFNENREGTQDVHTIVDCSSETACENAWNASLRFASEYATTELAWANDSTIMMRKPRNDDDISLVLTRVNSKNGRSASIVLEVRCNKTQGGEELCASDSVSRVKEAFSGYVSG